MQELIQSAESLLSEIESAIDQLNISQLELELNGLKLAAETDDFWQDNLAAQDNMKRQARLEKRITAWRQLEKETQDLLGLASLQDDSLTAEISKKIDEIRTSFEARRDQLKLSGPYDDQDAILAIHAGAGGTDAQDWAEMLLRMYVRWAENNDMEIKTIDDSAGEEAGIKSAVIEVNGEFAYGKLKSEHGVHRLVRLSPFNSDNLRQTSFAKVEIMPKIDQPEKAEIDDKDLKVDVYRSSGKGGQSVNTTDSAVRVTHIPTGIVVAIQNERSQLQNKETALTILRSRLIQLQMDQHAEKISQLKGPNEQAAWGNQIRSYVLHPYKQVKDLRTKHESSDPAAVLDGRLDDFINAYLEYNLSNQL